MTLTFNSFIDSLKASAEFTRAPDAPLNPSSENCFFCPAKLTCTAREEKALSAVLENFDDLGAPKRKQVEDVRLGQLYELIPFISEFLKDIEARVHFALANGIAIRNAKGVPYVLGIGKEGNRAWSDEQKVRAAIADMRIPDSAAFATSLLSPAAMEKFAAQRKSRKKGSEAPPPAPIGPLKWKRLQELIVRPPGKPTIVLETELRAPPPAAADDGASLFDDITAPAVAPAADTEIDLFN